MASSDFNSFLESHVKEAAPLSREVNIAYWNATISGKQSDFERSAKLQVKLKRLYSDPRDFERIRQWRADSAAIDPLGRRQIELLYNAYLRNQIDSGLNERITLMGSKIENQFNVYRPKIDGATVTSNDILDILKVSTDSTLRRKAWEAGKEVGAVVEEDLLTLVKLRNEAARSLGFNNYYSMSMELSEQDEGEIARLFDELAQLTSGPFGDLKQEADNHLAARYGVRPEEILPWHYEDPFFQEAPNVYTIDLDKYYENQEIVELVSRFYRGIGLVVHEILERSDLYEKPGKDQHAYCTDIDRNGDIRILANIKRNENWTGTMLHELGHAVHDKYIDPELPFLLRQEAHIFTTEAVAMLFGRLSKDADWIQQLIGISDEEKHRIADDLSQSLRLHQLVFARWSQVMMRFERELYLDPHQNLSERWWELVQRYQRLTRPDDSDFPHWAAKTHIVSVPVYYHNYLLGELLASQLNQYIRNNVIQEGASINDQPAVGNYMKENVFRPGAKYRWDEMIERATGEPLTPKYFVEQFVS